MSPELRVSDTLRVTKALTLLRFKLDRGDVFACERGTAVHLATAYRDLGVLDRSTVDPVIEPYLEGYEKFLREMKPLPRPGRGMNDLAIEEKLHGDGIEGTLDRRWTIGEFHWLVDIKTGSAAKWHRWQLAMYGCLWASGSGEAGLKHAALYLPGNGKYRFVPYHDSWRDREKAKSLITAARIAEEIHNGETDGEGPSYEEEEKI